jgi:hypothetical protein
MIVFGVPSSTVGRHPMNSKDIKWDHVKEMYHEKCPFCFNAAFRLKNEEGEQFFVDEVNKRLGDNWLLECGFCGAEWNQIGENTLVGLGIDISKSKQYIWSVINRRRTYF